ncbi:cytochrome D1 domain-containing protein [Ramlibacter sp. 2FC]|uniref:YVTN family beta-propeller repeat protein n=1 Tax=Ramlibacter sp. 2FC TaxID=2502188 RepID=UPI0010F457B8|nr:cytochrome D1 domain-containing protein [Ramlibacter sp. 2FC]
MEPHLIHRRALHGLSRIGLVGALLALLAAPAAAQVYVSSEKDHQILVLQPDGALLKTIAVCKRPRHMAWQDGRRRILVACGDSQQLGVVDPEAGRQVDAVPTGESPEIFGLSPDGRTAYVSIEEDSELAAYDLATKKPLFAVKTGGEPEGVLVAPDGRLAYVTSEVANAVHVIDLARRKAVAQIKVGKRPRRFALSPDGRELWVSNELGASVSIVDTASHTVKHTLSFELPGMRKSDITPVDLLMTPDGKTAWVGLGRANHVAEVDVASRAVRRVVLVGKRAWGLALSRDGSRLYVANGLSDDLSIVDTAGGRALKTVPAGRVPHSILVK